ncbi:pyrroline-5-carboxylate reductase [Flavisphingomonas formosensis]|uniref:pyrroline-5-carboxylate reductase n=1 Tax=Flavisphingomonas formosensis TaxID=861534 RepID=UPI0012FC3837|nr:pyrroline-5-carboxylate reductase [Sphingomonas formosensis]
MSGSVLLIGSGRMGGALARGWIATESVAVFDPMAPAIDGTRKLDTLDDARHLPQPLTVVIAVKPQMLDQVLPSLIPLAEQDALFVSVAAGATVARYTAILGDKARVVRTMPNTPAAIGKGITALVAGPNVDGAARAYAEMLLKAVGETVWVETEAQIDAVTAVSGSGPAYFFRFTEALARAGEREGLPPELAMKLARATFSGAGALADSRSDPIADLRVEVTSPGGTTAAALARFDADDALDKLVADAADACAKRSRELAG